MILRGFTLSLLLQLLAAICFAPTSAGWMVPSEPQNKGQLHERSFAHDRRTILETGLLSVFGIVIAGSSAEPAQAFDNKISTVYDDRPKRRGSKVGRTGSFSTV